MHTTNEEQHVPLETVGLYCHLVLTGERSSVDYYLMNRLEKED